MAEIYSIGESIKEKKKTKWMIGIVAAVIVLGIAVLLVLSYFFNNRCFTKYEIQSSVERSDSNNVEYRFLNYDLLKYSRSGISALDNEGTVLWNGGYEMTQPQIDVNGDYVLAADVTGKQFFVFNGEDEGVSMDTMYPIVRAKVSENGMVAALLQDTDSNVLNLYNPYNSAQSLLVEIPTNVKEEGYPLDFDVSPDANSVVASYLTMDGVKMENQVCFYNFTEVGQDKNTLVGGKTFGENMISAIEFLGDDKVAVFHEKGICVFTNMKRPEVYFELTFEEEIRSVAYSREYIAVVTAAGGSREGQQLRLYNLKGKEEMSCEIDYEYSYMEIYGDEIIFTSNHACYILRVNGREKFVHQFEEGMERVFPTKNSSLYTLIDDTHIHEIKLMGG